MNSAKHTIFDTKRKIVIVLLGLLPFFAFGFEATLKLKLAKEASTVDGYSFALYRIENTDLSQGYEYCVLLTTDDSEEHFTWWFGNLANAMEHFQWLKGQRVVYTANLFGENAQADKRNAWRTYAYTADFMESYINYHIVKEFSPSPLGIWR